MAKILNMVKYLLEAEAANAEFVEIRGDTSSSEPAFLMNVKVIKKNKEWDYFGRNVKVEKGKIYTNDKYVGDLKKEDGKYVASAPAHIGNGITGTSEYIYAETVAEAVFRFLKRIDAAI